MGILIIAYFVFLVGVGIFGVAAVYHAAQFGFPGDKTRLATILYLVTVVTILVVSFVLIGTTDFSGEAVARG